MIFWKIPRTMLMALPAETGHNLALTVMHYGEPWVQPRRAMDPILRTEFLGQSLAHPLGLAAGFDKNGRAFGTVLRMGAQAVELGSVTPLPQPGNLRPRLFRLTTDRAIINRMGFNNRGAAALEPILAAWRRAPRAQGLVGLSLASNSISRNPIDDFVGLAAQFAPLVDYLTFDISCPNSANGKIFLQPAALQQLLAAINQVFAADAGLPRPPLLAKLSPDLSDELLADLIGIISAAGIDGLILSNSTTARPADLQSRWQGELGGLSGRPLFAASTAQLAAAYAEIKRLPPRDRPLSLVGVGGVSTGREAMLKILAGASFVQIYTAMVYRGPCVFRLVARELAAELKQHGYGSVAEAVGQGIPKLARKSLSLGGADAN
ncbi:MAG: quinone-dependent dihydroorotate dehydrogenase [Alphaproteobacteria bacterium]|nr:quinone-dependent dihydroorotate dehydrogenase [Alphaproteobacteria bacterium]